MKVEEEALFTNGLGLKAPWVVQDVWFDTAKHRIDFDDECEQALLACPACGITSQKVHDRQQCTRRCWALFQYEALLQVAHFGCPACGKTTQIDVPWLSECSGPTLLFEALALTKIQDLPVRQAARDLRVHDKQLWQPLEQYVNQARKKQDLSGARIVRTNEAKLRREHDYVIVMHDLDAKRLLSGTPERDYQKVQASNTVGVCMAMISPYLRSANSYLHRLLVSYHRFRGVKLAGEVLDEVRRAEWMTDEARVQEDPGHITPKQRRAILWGMRRNPLGWTGTQIQTMHWLQRANIKIARAWRLKMALSEIFTSARIHNQTELAGIELKAWMSWEWLSRLAAFKRLAITLKTH